MRGRRIRKLKLCKSGEAVNKLVLFFCFVYSPFWIPVGFFFSLFFFFDF
jgi:hypothetical protein